MSYDDFLDRMMCGRVNRRPGRVGLGYLLNHHGMLKTEATIANLPDGRVWYGSAAASEFHDMDWLQSHLTPEDDVQIRSRTNEYTILVLAGPRSRDILSKASRADWSKEAFPWLSVRECFIGIAPAVVMGVSFSGELAYEIHIPNNQLHAAWNALNTAGAEHGLSIFGARAVRSMRLEKGYLHWKADILTEFDPFETGLDRFVKLDKGDFVGRDALLKRADQGPKRKFVTLHVDGEVAPARRRVGNAGRSRGGNSDFRRLGASRRQEPGLCFSGTGTGHRGHKGRNRHHRHHDSPRPSFLLVPMTPGTAWSGADWQHRQETQMTEYAHGFPAKYYQGPGAIGRIGELASRLGANALVMADGIVRDIVWPKIASSLDETGITNRFETFSGECSQPEIDRIAGVARAAGVDLIIAAGGGKGLDAGKAVAEAIGADMISVPTIASTDAPVSSVVVLYNDDHVQVGALFLKRAPSGVIVDSQIIANAPARLLSAGMGDALATWYEARACSASGARNFHGGDISMWA